MTEDSRQSTNPIAIAGLAFSGLAVVLYVITYVVADALPDTAAELETLRSTPAETTRFLISLGSAVLLNLVGLSLSVVGVLLPGRKRSTALTGIIVSALLLIGIPGVILLSLLGAR